MAENPEPVEAKLSDVFLLAWSVDTKDEVFQRWTQGFYFSDDEPTALVQDYGGPCSVIASVQAYLIKQLFINSDKTSGCEGNNEWRKIDDKRRQHLLCHTLVEMWELVTKENFQVVLMKNHFIQQGSETERLETVQSVGEPSSGVEDSYECTCKDYHRNICSRAQRQTQAVFHSTLKQFSCHKTQHLEDFIRRNIHQFEGTFGVLLFLYSILLSKGVEKIRSEMDENSTNSLIDPVHGHGGQSLVNLMLTGNAVSHVWDLERDIGGLKLKGISEQSNIGFLTLLESMRYCEEEVDRKNPADDAIRVFKSFDRQENGFIEEDTLKDVLVALKLESDPEYVALMESYLDPDSSGIILLDNFLKMFFPKERSGLLEESDFARSFQVYHYNGIPKCISKDDNRQKVVYSEGVCTLLSGDVMCISDGPFLNCLRTKWPYVIVEWKTETEPSLN